MKLFPCFLFLILFFSSLLFSAGLAEAGYAITIGSTGSDSEQNTINAALETVYNDGGGTVYLTAGTYTVNGSVYIGSNTELTGDP
jgi:hypothetical protein